MLHSTCGCPSMRLNETTADEPRSLEDFMKKCILLKPKLDSRYFLELGDNPFHKLYRGTNQDIVLTKYAHQPTSLSIEEWGGVEIGTQIENLLPSMGPPTPILTESQSLRNDNINLLLLISSDSEHSDRDTVLGLPFTERQECEDEVKESLTQAFISNESFSSIEKTPPLLIRSDELNLSTNKLTENQQTQDSESFFNSRDTMLFQYTQQMQMQSQSKSSPIIIQDETPLVSMGPSNSLHSSVIIESPNTDTDESYSSIESDSPTLSSQHSAGSNLITGETATDLHTEHNAISIGNRTYPNFKPKRIKLTKTLPEEKGIITHIKQQQQQQQNTHKLKTDVFKRPKLWTVQEEQLLVIGVNKYGLRWNKIHTDYNFSSSRTPVALCTKYHALKKNGKYSKYLREFRKNAGYKSHEQSKPEEYNSDKVPIDEIRSAIPRETTTNSNALKATSDRLTNPANSEERRSRRLRNRSTPEYKWWTWTKNEINNLMRGHELFGNDWDAILKNYSFSPRRNIWSLINKYYQTLKRSGDSFYNDIQDPILPSI